MKSILLATDFSDAASNAAAYGVELAKVMGASAILFSACEHSPVPISEVPVITTPESLKDQVQRQLNDDARLLMDIHELAVTTCCKTGTTHQALEDALTEYKADLVVVGMKPHNSKMFRMMGNTVTHLVRKLETPLLIVPGQATFANINRIAIAIDHDVSTDCQVGVLREIAIRFHTRLYIVRVVENSGLQGPENGDHPYLLIQMLQPLDLQFEHITGSDVPASLTGFIEQNNIDMLTILPHQHAMIESWFTQSTTKAMAFECPVPLLVLPPSS